MDNYALRQRMHSPFGPYPFLAVKPVGRVDGDRHDHGRHGLVRETGPRWFHCEIVAFGSREACKAAQRLMEMP